MKNSATGGFDPQDMLYASEIGLVVGDVSQTVDEINDSLGMTAFKGKKVAPFHPWVMPMPC